MKLIPLRPDREFSPKGWRFYEAELQNLVNEDPLDLARYNSALKKQERLNRKYLQHLNSLRERLPATTYARFAAPTTPLFDSNLLTFSVGDALGRSNLLRWKPNTAVRAQFLSFDMETIHTLHYAGVDSLAFEMPRKQWFRGLDLKRKSIDSLIHHELTSFGKQLMQHFLLFVPEQPSKSCSRPFAGKRNRAGTL